MNEKISVIVPVYNAEAYLARCVDSILGQTYKNLDVILVDDGSPDNCPAMCDAYAERDLRVRVIHQDNRGVAAARNAGLDAAVGDFIGFVDSDDAIHPRMYELLLRGSQEAGTSISMCGYRDQYEQAAVHNDPVSEEYKVESSRDAMLKAYGMHAVAYIFLWNKIYRRELFEGIRLPAGKISEELFIFYRLYEQVEMVVVVQAVLYSYFKNNGVSITSRPTFRLLRDKAQALDDSERYFRSRGDDELANRTGEQYLEAVLNMFRYVKPGGEFIQTVRRRYMQLYRKKYRDICGKYMFHKRYRAFYYFPRLSLLGLKLRGG